MKRELTAALFVLSCVWSYGQSTEHLTLKQVSFLYFSMSDTNVQSYHLPENFVKPKKWVDAEKSRFDHEFYGGTYPKTYELEDALSAIDTAKNFSTVCAAKSWCLHNYEQVFPFLVARLSMKTFVGLKNTGDLIIWERFLSGDLKFYGHGGGMQEDIFTIAGRASWILNELTGESFAVVHADLTEAQAIEFKRLWVDYVKVLGK